MDVGEDLKSDSTEKQKNGKSINLITAREEKTECIKIINLELKKKRSENIEAKGKSDITKKQKYVLCIFFFFNFYFECIYYHKVQMQLVTEGMHYMVALLKCLTVKIL